MADEAKLKKQSAKELAQPHLKASLAAPGQKPHERKQDALTEFFKVNCPVCHQIQHAVALLTTESEILISNPHLELLLGFSSNDLQGRKMTSLMSDQSSAEFLAFLAKNIKGTRGPFDVELATREGAKVWASFETTPFTLSGDTRQCFLASITDITDHKRLSDDLSLCTNLLDTAPDSIFLRDPDGSVLYVNTIAYKERGYSHDELMKADIFQLVAPEYHSIVREKRKAVLTKGTVSFEAAHLTKDGTAYPVEVHLSLIDHAGKKLILSVVHNASQRKRIEVELTRALKMESVALVTSGIAGQFNTLVTHIIGNLNVMMSEAEPNGQQYKLLQETDRYADRARDLVRHLLSFSAGGAPVKRVTSVAGLIRDTADFVLSGSNAWCNYYVADDLHEVELDEAQFVQAFSNVVQNASQAMPKGGIIKISARNVHMEDDEIPGLLDGDYVKISVEDRGHGISPENLQRIFDPYFTTRQGKVGLGLSIAYSVIRNHGGTITVDSQHGKGSTFNLFLPTASEQQAAEATPPLESARGVKMLIVDDEEVVTGVGSRMLNRLGYDKVVFASNGPEALSKYKAAMESADPFDIVIIDLTIPGSMGGKEVVKALLEMDSGANIMISSGYFNDPIVTDFRRYGIKGVLAKPYRLDELELMLREAHKEEVPH
jgi:PAS domain S-box-containing protein